MIGRFVALNRALARAFDDDPNFEGVAFQESGLMIGPEVRREHAYTPRIPGRAHSNAHGSSQAFRRSQVFWYMNHFEGGDPYLGDIAKAVIGSRVVMGGPDILPYRRGCRRHTSSTRSLTAGSRSSAARRTIPIATTKTTPGTSAMRRSPGISRRRRRGMFRWNRSSASPGTSCT